MREWFLPMAPVAAIIYFTAFPGQFSALIDWAQHMIH
jgi:hypothetical protein